MSPTPTSLISMICLLTISMADAASEPEASSSNLHFENSCSPAIQEQFRYGVTMLHSFEYPETSRVFSELIETEPGCAMAYWGAAMSLWHPLWAPPSAEDLLRGAALLAETELLETTDRERAYINALGTFFSDTNPDTHAARAQSYTDAMAHAYGDSYETDPESAVFYALALLASAEPLDKTYCNQFKAAGLLNWVGESQPTHPGVLHYTIHSYDFPGLAHLALSAATVYAQAAPDSAHAQHMPSHIFTRLGLWEQSLSSNHDSTRSAAMYTERAHLPGQYDEGLHSMDYLMYAMLQMARDEEAAALLEDLAEIERTDSENFKVAYTYASSPARYALERREWAEAAELSLVRQDFAWENFGFAQSIYRFARGLGAARSDQIEQARQEIEAIRALQSAMPASTLTYWREQVQVHIDVVTAWVLLAEGDTGQALDLASTAADLEDSVDKHPVTPGEVLPARELYADMLLQTEAPERALMEYQTVLRHSPNRLNALLGASIAAESTGQSELAKRYREMIRIQVKNGSGPRAEALRIYEG